MKRLQTGVGAALVAAAAGAAWGQVAEGPLPRYATAEEQVLEALRPRIADRGPGGSPTGPIMCPGEYAPMDGIILSYHPSYSAAQLAIVHEMAVKITTIGQARAYIVFGSAAQRNMVLNSLEAAGAEMSRVVPMLSSLNSIWMRDYGPRYIYEGDCRAIVDHTYNRTGRTLDNNFPIVFGANRRHMLYTLPLIHGGGNYHLDSLGRGHATRLINNENPSLTEAQIVALWQQYQGVTTGLYTPFATTVDATQHIDMWMQVVAEDKVMISDWPANPGSAQDNICEDAANNVLPAMGYQVYRLPARRVNNTHYTYTNVVMCNDLVLIPSYTNPTIEQYNAQALATYQQALPDKVIHQVNCEALVGLAGVMHCIVMHVPAFRGEPASGGFAPTAYLRGPNGGETLTPGQTIDLRWISDDDEQVVNVDIELSFDSGATWPVTIAAATADDRSHLWTVPNYFSRNARVRVVARDADGRTGFDASDADFTIAGDCRADFNNSLSLTVQDIFDFLSAYFANDPRADVNDQGGLSVQDVFDFLALYFAECE